MENLTGELFGALALAQSEFLPIEKNMTNPHWGKKYADLVEIRRATTLALSKHGLAIIQLIIPDDTIVILETMLCHKSGQKISSTIKLRPTKADPQGFGSAITYARRYSLSAMLGVAADDDDDGNDASGKDNKKADQTTPLFSQLLDEYIDIGVKNGYKTEIDMWLANNQIILKDLTEEQAEKTLVDLKVARKSFKKDGK